MAYSYSPKDLIRRYDVLKEDRILWEPFFRDVRDYIRPRKQNVDSSGHINAERHTNKMFDSSAPEASRIMAMSMQNALVPQSVVWFGLSIPTGHPLSFLNKVPSVKRWFHDVTQKMFFFAFGMWVASMGVATSEGRRHRQSTIPAWRSSKAKSSVNFCTNVLLAP